MNSLNSVILKDIIDDSGITMTAIAEKLGISRESLYHKVNGKTEFTASQIMAVQKILHLSNDARDAVFFGREREL